MSMEKRRDEIGKLLACLLVSRKGASRIEDLERDYRENEGRSIPYKEFGCISLLDFFRSISKHVKVESRSGRYMLYPIVSDKIKHVNDLVCRQRPAKRSNTSFRRRPARSSRYYPTVRDRKPFVPNTVQQEVAKILTSNPNGVNKSYIAQCLERSTAIAGEVNVNNIDEYLSSMPYIASTRGNMVFPSLSLRAIIDTNIRRKEFGEDIDGFDIVTPGNSETVRDTLSRNNNTKDTTTGVSYPAGTEEDEENDDEFEIYEEYENPATTSNLDNNYAANNDVYQSHDKLSKTDNENTNRHRMSSAEFICKAGSQYSQTQYDGFVRQNNNLEEENCHENGVGSQELPHDNIDQRDEENDQDNGDTFISDEDDGEAMDIISPRIISRLQQLIEKNPDGIWCADLLQVYLNEFNVPLDYADLGFASVCSLASNMPKVFHLHRHNNRGDFMLYDATKPIPESASQHESQAANTVWENEYYDDDVDPFPMALPLSTSQSLVPQGVMTHGESVGQERIPEHWAVTGCLEVYVVEVYTPSLFWIHLRKKRSKLSRLMESMHEFYQSNGDNYTIPHVILEKGLNCVCTFEDKWHRAIIKTVKPDGNVTLVFYDYGTRKTYPPDSLRFLVRTFSHLPAQAIPCGLYNVKPINANAWTKGVSAEFYNRVADTPLIAMVGRVDKENNSMLVSLVDTREESMDLHINDLLVEEGFAESGSMGDTVSLECSYLEDLITADQAPITAQLNVPLITPQSTLPENSGITLKPPPGLAKPTEPMNYAAFMDECLNGRSYATAADLGNSTFINSDAVTGNANLNNNPLASLIANYNPLLPLSEAFIQFCTKRVEMELATAVSQFFLSNNNSSVLNNTILNNTASSTAKNTDPITEQSCTNPFRSYQENREQGNSTNYTNHLEESTNDFMNLNMNESNHCDSRKNTTLPNLNSRDSKPPGSREQKLFPSNPMMKEFATASNDFTDFTGNYRSNLQENDQEFTGQRLHDTNPFKQHLVGDYDSKFNSGGELESLRRDFGNKDTVVKPPIPPRNPNFINAKLPVYNPATKIYYQAGPVMYNNDNSKTQGRTTTKSDESVSFRGNNYNADMKQSQDLTNHSLNNDNLYNFDKNKSSEGDNQNPLQSPGLYSPLNNVHTNNIFTPSTKFDTNNPSPQCFNARITLNSYRPPPPPYNENNSLEYLYRTQKKNSISPRFTSPIISTNSKAAIEEVQLATDVNIYEKLESGITETPVSINRSRKIQPTSSSSSLLTNNNTTSESTLYCESSPAWANNFYTDNFILPKLQQEQQQKSTESFKQDLPDTSHQRKVPSKTSASGSSTEDKKNISIKQENNFTSYQAVYNPIEAFPKNSERPESERNLFGTGTTSNRRTPEACPSLGTREPENTSTAMPSLHNQQSSVIEQDLYHRDSNSNITSKRDTTVDENRLKFSNAEPPGSRIPQTNPYQPRPVFPPQFPSLYPNLGDLHRGQRLPVYHQMPYPDVRPHPPVGPRPVPLFRPSVHGFYPPPPPHWPRPQFFNPAYPYMHSNAPPPFQQPYAWNPYHPNMFTPAQTIPKHGMTVPNSQTTTETNSIKENVDASSRLSHGQEFEEENREDVDAVPSEETKIDSSEFRKHRMEIQSPLTDPIPPGVPEELTNTKSDEKLSSKDCVLSTQLDEFHTPIADDEKSDNEIENCDEKETCTDKRDTISSGSLPRRNYSDKSMNETVNTKETSRSDINNIFKPVEVNNQIIYLFNIDNEGWASTDEIALVFTNFENRHSILRILDDIVKLQINFMEVSRAQSPLVFDKLDGTTIRLPRMTNSKKIKGTLHLTPLKSLIPMMYWLKVISIEDIKCSHLERRLPSGSKAFDLLKLIKAYNSNDEYWAA